MIIVISDIPSHVFKHFDERRELHAFLLCNTLRLEDHEIADRLQEGIDLEVLTLPDETLPALLDRRAIGVGLLQHLLIEVVVHLTLRLDHLCFGDLLL